MRKIVTVCFGFNENWSMKFDEGRISQAKLKDDLSGYSRVQKCSLVTETEFLQFLISNANDYGN